MGLGPHGLSWGSRRMSSARKCVPSLSLLSPLSPAEAPVLSEASLPWLGGLGPRQGLGVSSWLGVGPQKPLGGLSVVRGGRAEVGTLSGLWVCDHGGPCLAQASPWLPLRELPQLQSAGLVLLVTREGTLGATPVKHVTASFYTVNMGHISK